MLTTTIVLRERDFFNCRDGHELADLVRTKLLEAGMTDEQIKASTRYTERSIMNATITVTMEYPDAQAQ